MLAYLLLRGRPVRRSSPRIVRCPCHVALERGLHPASYAAPATWPWRGESPSNAIGQSESEGRMWREGQGVHSRVLPHQCRPIGERGESPSNAISQSESEGRIFSLQLYIARVRACTAAVSGTCNFAYLWYKESGRRKSLFFILSSQNCKTSTGN